MTQVQEGCSFFFPFCEYARIRPIRRDTARFHGDVLRFSTERARNRRETARTENENERTAYSLSNNYGKTRSVTVEPVKDL